MNKAAYYIKETTRSGSVLWDTAVCEPCLKIHLRDVQLRAGDKRRTSVYTGADRDCSWCEAEEVAESVSAELAKAVQR